MEKLRILMNTELVKSEFIKTLDTTVTSDQVIRDVRLALYDEARSKGLMDEGDQPVNRRKSAKGKTVKVKHIDDIWCLMCSIKNSRQVEHVLLKNGKRSLKGLEQSRKLTSTSSAKTTPSLLSTNSQPELPALLPASPTSSSALPPAVSSLQSASLRPDTPFT